MSRLYVGGRGAEGGIRLTPGVRRASAPAARRRGRRRAGPAAAGAPGNCRATMSAGGGYPESTFSSTQVALSRRDQGGSESSPFNPPALSPEPHLASLARNPRSAERTTRRALSAECERPTAGQRRACSGRAPVVSRRDVRLGETLGLAADAAVANAVSIRARDFKVALSWPAMSFRSRPSPYAHDAVPPSSSTSRERRGHVMQENLRKISR